MDSVPGQTFLNYAYSWGAAIVILGALFKLTHLPGGNLMLFIGMGTEVIVFFLAAFDRPFDKNEIDKELAKHYVTDAELEAQAEASDDQPEVVQQGSNGHVIFVGGEHTAESMAVSPAEQIKEAVTAAAEAGLTAVSAGSGQREVADRLLTMPHDADAEQLAAIIRAANDELLHRAQAVLSPEMEDATKIYIEKLRTLTDTFAKVDEQSARLTRDSEEMENLNRTLTGINKVYELHLKSISLQVGTIDEINNQTHKLSEQIQHLNQVYGRMIEALTVNFARNAATPNVEDAEESEK